VDLDDFVEAYLPGKPRNERVEAERFKCFDYDELITRDKVNLDLTWMKDPALDDADSLLPPEVIAQEIVEDLQAALTEFAAIAEALGSEVSVDPDVIESEVAD
jgi:type I restriction enzyme M protein